MDQSLIGYCINTCPKLMFLMVHLLMVPRLHFLPGNPIKAAGKIRFVGLKERRGLSL